MDEDMTELIPILISALLPPTCTRSFVANVRMLGVLLK